VPRSKRHLKKIKGTLRKRAKPRSRWFASGIFLVKQRIEGRTGKNTVEKTAKRNVDSRREAKRGREYFDGEGTGKRAGAKLRKENFLVRKRREGANG